MILRADHPYNHVACAIGGGDKRRPATAIVPCSTPTRGDGRRAGGRDAKCRKRAAARAESNVGALFGSISCRCLDDEAIDKMARGYRGTDTAKIVSFNQICVAILS